jgi:ABC-type uncharacterized transport system permease subunit
MIAKRIRQTLETAAIPILATLLGLLVSTIFVFFAQTDPIQTYNNLFCEGFGPRGCQTFGDIFVFHTQAEDGTTQTFFGPT